MTFYNKKYIKNILIKKIHEKAGELEDIFVANDLRKIAHNNDIREVGILANCVCFRMIDDNEESWQYNRDEVIKLIIEQHESLIVFNHVPPKKCNLETKVKA